MILSTQNIIDYTGASKFAPVVSHWFTVYSDQYEVNTNLRMAAFISQVTHESGYFKYTKEIWGPTAQQLKYERDFNYPWPQINVGERNYVASNLGNSEHGDGAKFKGHGYIQITGRSNHVKCSEALFNDSNVLLIDPEKLCTEQYSMQSALWFWHSHGLNEYADKQMIKSITRRINGGTTGLLMRVAIYNRICTDLNLPHYMI